MGQSSSAPIRGETGPMGVSITSASINPTGLMTLTFSNGKTQTVQVPPGNPGVGIKSATVNATGLITFTMTDGTTNTVQIPMGLQGPIGPQGIPGVKGDTGPQGNSVTGPIGPQGIQGPIGNSGVGIATASVDNTSGLITFTMTDGTTKAVQIPKGLTGSPGVSIKAVTVNGTGLMTLTMSDNSTQSVQLPVGSVPQANLMYCAGNVCSNPLVGIDLTNNWQGIPTATNGLSEISNDTTTYKALMLAGNMSAGNGRQVNIYDDLRIDRNLTVGGNSSLSNQLGLNNLKPSYTFDMASNSASDSARIKNTNSAGYASVKFENDKGIASYIGVGGSGAGSAYANNLYLASGNIVHQGPTTFNGDLTANGTSTFTGTTNLNGGTITRNNTTIGDNTNIVGTATVSGDLWSKPYYYVNSQTGYCLDAGQFGSGQGMVTGCTNGNPNQQWQYNLQNGMIRNNNTNNCVSSFGGNNNTTPWPLQACNKNTPDHQFTKTVGNGMQSFWGNCVDPSTGIRNAACNGTPSQKWTLKENV
jgi:hypothetical protein